MFISVSLSVRLFYLHWLSQGSNRIMTRFLQKSVGNYIFWNDLLFSPYSSASHRRSPLLIFRITQNGQNFSDLTSGWIDVRMSKPLKLKALQLHTSLFLLECKNYKCRHHGPKSPKTDEFASKCWHALYFCKTLIAQFPSKEILALICEHVLELKMIHFFSRTNSLAFVIKCLV